MHADKTNKKEIHSRQAGQQALHNSAIQLQDNRPKSSIQLKQAEALATGTVKRATIQQKENKTGLPDQLKSGIENLSGHSMDDVKVHYNSGKPAQLNAHAYAQGTEIHLASGQEKHLPHEAWHVAQQKQGRVKPTLQMKGKINVNDDKNLEYEADKMGAKAYQFVSDLSETIFQKQFQRSMDIRSGVPTTQLVKNPAGDEVPATLYHATNTEQATKIQASGFGGIGAKLYLATKPGLAVNRLCGPTNFVKIRVSTDGHENYLAKGESDKVWVMDKGNVIPTGSLWVWNYETRKWNGLGAATLAEAKYHRPVDYGQ